MLRFRYLATTEIGDEVATTVGVTVFTAVTAVLVFFGYRAGGGVAVCAGRVNACLAVL